MSLFEILQEALKRPVDDLTLEGIVMTFAEAKCSGMTSEDSALHAWAHWLTPPRHGV